MPLYINDNVIRNREVKRSIDTDGTVVRGLDHVFAEVGLVDVVHPGKLNRWLSIVDFCGCLANFSECHIFDTRD
jgi:hypothetical protein